MTDDEREALVERMAIARHEHRRRLTPLVVSLGWYDLDTDDQARMLAEERAALAVAEPVVRADEREVCADMVDCGCAHRADVLAVRHENSGDRWRACGVAECGALNAKAIRARGAA